MNTPRIAFTGGGTAGHVTPNVPLIHALKAEGWQIHYIGSKASVEESMMHALSIPFHAIASGKLRRYFSWQNFVDPFRIVWGILQAYVILRKLKTNLVFSKGGFVAFPVVFAAWLLKIPVIAHESDMTPGLANRLSFPFVNKICLTFDASQAHFKPSARVIVTGTPIRAELFQGNKEEGLKRCGFHHHKPCLLIMGGSLGANQLNTVVRKSLSLLNAHYQVIHLSGKGKSDANHANNPEYRQFEYANEELPDLLAAADMIISRAGANALSEILALKKLHVLIPLSAKASRGDQIENARYFSQQGISKVIDEENLSPEVLIAAIDEVNKQREAIISKMANLGVESATGRIIQIIKEQLRMDVCL